MIKRLLILLHSDRVIRLTSDGPGVFTVVHVGMELPVTAVALTILG